MLGCNRSAIVGVDAADETTVVCPDDDGIGAIARCNDSRVTGTAVDAVEAAKGAPEADGGSAAEGPGANRARTCSGAKSRLSALEPLSAASSSD
jgi:hypothetical protein